MSAKNIRRNVFKDKLDEKFENIGDFIKRSGVPVSMETVRRLITERMPVNTMSLLMISKYLGFTNDEIKSILTSPEEYVLNDPKELRYATDMSDLVVKGGEAITEQERALLEAMRALEKKNRSVYSWAIQFLLYICTKEGLECRGVAALIPPPESKGKGRRRR